jgi:hypothetical protein
VVSFILQGHTGDSIPVSELYDLTFSHGMYLETMFGILVNLIILISIIDMSHTS